MTTPRLAAQLAKTRPDPVATAYRAMAQIGYRPKAPSDGYGNITVPLDELHLDDEVRRFVQSFRAADNRMEHWTGCTNYTTSGVVAMLIEAVRILNGGSDGNPWALAVLREAVATLEQIR